MLKFNPVSKDRLFFDQYEYSICLSIADAGVLRAKTKQEFHKNVSYRNSSRYLWNQRNSIEGKGLANLLTVFDEIDRVRDQIKITVSFDVLYIYSNSTSVLQRLADVPCVRFCSAAQVVVDRPRDVILKTNPKFKYRSYFKERMLEDHERDRLLDFLESREEVFGITNTLKFTLSKRRFHWLPRHLYVEHNDPKDITMLSLVMPGIIRKTFVVQAK